MLFSIVQTHGLYVVDHSLAESEDFNVLLSECAHIIDAEVEKLHVMQIIGQLIEANILDSR